MDYHTTTPFSTARYGPNSHDDGGRPMTVQHILNNHNRDTNGDQNNDDLMIFAGNNSRLHSLVFAEDLPANAWMQHQLHLLSAKDDKANNQPFRSYLSIARKSEGLTFHKHGDTFLTLVTGTKDWLIALSTHDYPIFNSQVRSKFSRRWGKTDDRSTHFKQSQQRYEW